MAESRTEGVVRSSDYVSSVKIGKYEISKYLLSIDCAGAVWLGG